MTAIRDGALPAGRDCLIGSTGFVGGTLQRQRSFAALYNSSNVGEIAGQTFGTVVCAAAPGSMFEANNFPDRDREKVQALIDRLSDVTAGRFILISSIAVLEDFAGGDDEATTAFQTKLAYGRHRRMLEVFCEQHFPNCLVVRLPALFGAGLRKNFLFDLLNPVPTFLSNSKLLAISAALRAPLGEKLRAFYARDPATGLQKLDRAALDRDPIRLALDPAITALGQSATQFHHAATTYQYYDLSRLWSDIGVAAAAGLGTIHLVSEPLEAARIHQRLTGQTMPQTGARLHREDMRTRHADLWSRKGPYLDDAESVLDRLAAFYRSERHAP